MKDNINILLYYDVSGFPERKGYDSLAIINDHFINMLIMPMKKSGANITVKTILPEATYIKNQESNILSDLNPIPFSIKEIKEIFGHNTEFEKLHTKTYKGDFTETEKEKLNNLILSKLDGYNPDIIITYPIGETIFKSIFPKSLILTAENSIFSRPPFPRTLQYDPMDLFNSFVNKYKEEINNFPITESQNECIEDLKRNIVNITNKYNPALTVIEKYKSKFKYLVLAPLTSIEDVYKDETVFSNDFDYLYHIMENIPEDIGVIVTQHDFEKGLLNKEILPYFKTKYKNLIFIEELNNLLYGSSSLNFYNSVDAIITTVTMTGINSIFWDKKIISLSTTYNDWICDKKDLTNLEEFLAQPKKNKNNLIFWYLTHYPLFVRKFTDGKWLFNYFSNKLKKFNEEGITFEYFEPIEDIEDLTKYILNHITKFYEVNYAPKPNKKPNKKVTLLQKIFSVTNIYGWKTITIFNKKIKIKRKDTHFKD